MIERLKEIHKHLLPSYGYVEKSAIALGEIIEELEAKEPKKHDNCIVNILTPGEPPKAVSLIDVVVHMDDTGYFAISGVKAK